MSNYVSIRTKPCTMTQAYNQMKHDMRLNKPPAYLRDEPNITAKIHDARTGEVLNIATAREPPYATVSKSTTRTNATEKNDNKSKKATTEDALSRTRSFPAF